MQEVISMATLNVKLLMFFFHKQFHSEKIALMTFNNVSFCYEWFTNSNQRIVYDTIY